MDRKSILILAASVLLLWVGSVAIDHFFPPQPARVTAGTNQPALLTNGGRLADHPVAVAPVVARAAAHPAGAPEKFITVSNAEVVFHFTSRGGGLKQIDLTEYPAVTRRSVESKVLVRPASLNTGAAVPVGAVLGYGAEGDDEYALTRAGNVVRAEKMFTNGIKLVKEFDFGTNYPFSIADLGGATNHLFTGAGALRETRPNSPTSCPRANLSSARRRPSRRWTTRPLTGRIGITGRNRRDIKDAWFANRTLGCLPGTPRSEYVEGAGNVAWVAVHNQFFALAAAPAQPAPQVIIDKVELPPPDTNGLDAAPRFPLTNGFQAALAYPATTLAPGQTLESVVTFYAGPKEYKTLGKLGQDMGNNLDAIMDFGGPTGFFSKGLLICMNALHATGLDYGLCIIAITVIIKGIFWPLTAAGGAFAETVAGPAAAVEGDL